MTHFYFYFMIISFVKNIFFIILFLFFYRPVECDRAKSSLHSKWNGIIWIAEDQAIIDRSMDISSSREVRFNIKANKSVKHLVGNLIDSYFKYHRIGAKVSFLYVLIIFVNDFIYIC